MKISLLFLLSAFALLLPACGLQLKEVEVQTVSIQNQGGPCAGDTTACMEVKVNYPELETQGDTTLEAINRSLQDAVKRAFLFEDVDPRDYSLEEVTRLSIADYESLLEEDSTYTMNWGQEVNGSVVYENGRVFCVQLTEYSFFGGAHPNNFTRLLNFDLLTGKPVDLTLLIEDVEAFEILAEKAFRETRELSAEDNLNEAGFFWEGDFELPREMGLTEKGLLLLYNNYEAAPYVMGPTELVLPYEEVRPLMAENPYFPK